MYGTKQPYPEACAYVDTVELTLRNRLTKKQVQQIRGRVSAGHFGGFFPEYKKHGFRLRLHQPSPAGIMWLDRAARLRGWCLIGLHVAIDVFPTEQPRHLRRWILEHLSQPHRRSKKPRNEYAGTTYTGGRLDARNIVVYADRPSKLNGTACVHIELRLRRSITLHRAGISSVESIARLDLPELLRRHIQFRTFSRHGNLLARSIREAGDHINAMLVRKACGHYKRRPERLLKPIDPPFIWPTSDRDAQLTTPKRKAKKRRK